MICENSAWVTPVFWGVAWLAIVLTLYVMQKTEKDEINRRDPRWIQWLRRAGFWAMALLLGNAMRDNASQLSLLLVFGSGVYSLAINAIALRLRTPPPSAQEGAQHRSTTHGGYLAAREFDALTRGQERLDEGQLQVLRLLEAVLLNMELKPDLAVIPAVVYPKQFKPRKQQV